MKYTLNDIFIVPSAESNVSSRKECNPYYEDLSLPLFASPMTSVVDLDNYKLFKENKIHPIIPRNVDLEIRLLLMTETWCAFSLEEFEKMAKNMRFLSGLAKAYVLIDIANGHMKRLHNVIANAKEKYGENLKIMAGNIANPKTYAILSEIGVDYVRVGIGTGSVCITSSNTAIHYPMASLIKECYEISCKLNNPAKIVADGGMKNYDDIIKALALGADYVMCGSIFNKMIESSATTFKLSDGIYNMVDQYSLTREDLKDNNYIKLLYGMSTKKAQKELGSIKLKTSEGIEKYQNVEYTMEQWCENFTDYLKSTMSYTSCFELNDFIGEVETIIVSNNSVNSINK